MKNQINKRKIRHKRVRAKIKGDAACPRLCVFRSNKHIYLQAVNDVHMKTILSADDLTAGANLPTGQAGSGKKKQTKKENARAAGKVIAEKLVEKNIKKVVFDRGGYKYHGRIKEAAEGAREGGLQF